MGVHLNTKIYISRFSCIFVIITFCTFGVKETDGKEILIGMTTALSGPAEALGQGMKLGVEVYFNKINKTGGINNNILKLVAVDDGYEPYHAAPNMRKLINKSNVIAVIGNVGTPTAIVTVPIANEKRTLLFGAFTGAGVLRKNPPDRYVINYRASYAEETAAMIDGLISIGVKPSEIAFFTQNDGYGDAGYNGAVKALRATGYNYVEKLSHGRYTRNTLNVEDGLATILDAKIEPKAIILVGAYAPCAKFIKMAREDFPDVIFLNVSFVGSVPLAKELGSAGEGVIVTQVVPHFNSDLPGIKEYQKALSDFSTEAEAGFVSLEGFLAAKIFVNGLKAAGSDITKESIIDGIESLKDLDIGIGININLSKTEHQGCHQVWPTIIKDGKYMSLNWSDLK